MGDARNDLSQAMADPLSFESFRSRIRSRPNPHQAVVDAVVEIEEELDQIGERLEALLEDHPLAVKLHVLSLNFWSFRGDPERAKLHHRVLRALFESILLSGDGLSMETAFVVDSVAEEYLLLQAMGLQQADQEVVPAGEKFYDRLGCVDDAGEVREIWFDVTGFYTTAYGAGEE